jgi:RNA polymerase subunit RPABC4/transcription elongation factor Spt4
MNIKWRVIAVVLGIVLLNVACVALWGGLGYGKIAYVLHGTMGGQRVMSFSSFGPSPLWILRGLMAPLGLLILLALIVVGLVLLVRAASPSPAPAISERICSECGEPVEVDGKVCSHCGAELPVTLEQPCSNCGEAVRADWIWCPYCDTELP